MSKSITALLFISLVIVSSWLGVNYLFEKGSFPVKQIAMVNKLHEQDVDKLQELITDEIDGGFFSLDIEKLRKNLEKLAWIDTVSLRKKWPDTLQLDIHEKQVAARWIASNTKKRTIKKLKQVNWDKQSLISDKGVLFKTALTQQQYKKINKLAIYSTPDELSMNGLQKCQNITQIIKTVNLHVMHCFQDQRRSWFLKLNNGFDVFLGQQQILQRTEIFIAAYQQILNIYEKNIEKIDLRYTNGFAIKWKVLKT
ncbi:MAG: FtsQ-type POTRA domain-containing protein [Pseudomonadota bacterium]